LKVPTSELTANENLVVIMRAIRRANGDDPCQKLKVFAGSVPENYDRYMVPLIFEPYAAEMARCASSFSPGTVLETAAGQVSPA
jgi:hypothetical protein